MTPISPLNGSESPVAVKPCPFCGGRATAVRISPHPALQHAYDAVLCVGCQARTALFDGRSDAIAVWNRRASPVPGSEEVVADLDRCSSRMASMLVHSGWRPHRSHVQEMLNCINSALATLTADKAEIARLRAERADIRHLAAGALVNTEMNYAALRTRAETAEAEVVRLELLYETQVGTALDHLRHRQDAERDKAALMEAANVAIVSMEFDVVNHRIAIAELDKAIQSARANERAAARATAEVNNAQD